MYYKSEHEKNVEIARYLNSDQDCSPDEVGNPYMTLGTHPDLVERLWDQLAVTLPENCRWVVGNRPVLMRKDSGVVFGIAIGTLFYALRLPAAEREQLAVAQTQLVDHWITEKGLTGKDRERYRAGQLAPCDIGSSWINGKWLSEEIEFCQVAFRWAA